MRVGIMACMMWNIQILFLDRNPILKKFCIRIFIGCGMHIVAESEWHII